ncbi:storkhead-box protein 1-like [Uloborus diversus]|uniref:storkhead-box protein 1-like n=1 Tax=Uloborus diversus TaxID=327109 RepID=UPI0024096D07|nr:storkhead-box protein 1-like [Uloborus diversus]
MNSRQQLESRHSSKHVLINQNCLAIVLHRIAGLSDGGSKDEDGHRTFADFLQQNSLCFWNGCLTRSVASLEYRGCLVPCTLLVCGTDFALEVIRSAWARRVLRPPKGYGIGKLGDVGFLEMVPALQTQFAPLSEALCKVVADLNDDRVSATTTTLKVRLEENFPEMQVPSEEILYKTLGGLIKERKLYHTGGGYTYRQRAVSPLCERQMLMTNEEAIVRLHANRKECSLAVQVDEADIAAAWRCSTSSFMYASKTDPLQQTPGSPDIQLLERSHSLKVTKKGRPKTTDERGGSLKEKSSSPRKFRYQPNDFEDVHKNEKQSMLTKIFKRMQALTDKPSKHVVFSTQFPPLEWMEADKILYHSVATQTMIQKTSSKPGSKQVEATSSRVPWNDMDNFERRAIPHFWSPISTHKKGLNFADGNNTRKTALVSLRQNNSKQSPLHRYSYGPLSNNPKRRHRHRRSSSESPKIVKPLLNNYHSQSTSSKSPADYSEDKESHSSTNAATLAGKSKAPLNSCHNSPAVDKTSKNYIAKSIPTRQFKSNELQKNPTGSKTVTDTKSNASKKCQMSKNMAISPEPKAPKNKEKIVDIAPANHDSEDQSLSVSDAKLAVSESSSELSGSGNNSEVAEKEIKIPPPILKSFLEMPKQPNTNSKPNSKKEIIIDNSVSVEVAVEKTPLTLTPKGNNVSTTIVTEETTVTKGKGNSKVVTVTSITTSLSRNEKEKFSVNNLNIENEKDSHIVDCSSTCNIVTEVK